MWASSLHCEYQRAPQILTTHRSNVATRAQPALALLPTRLCTIAVLLTSHACLHPCVASIDLWSNTAAVHLLAVRAHQSCTSLRNCVIYSIMGMAHVLSLRTSTGLPFMAFDGCIIGAAGSSIRFLNPCWYC
jgi:hypothetical protein